MIVHNTVLHLHASPTHPTPRHPSSGFCCYIQPQLMHAGATGQVQVICLYSSMLNFFKQVGRYTITDLS